MAIFSKSSKRGKRTGRATRSGRKSNRSAGRRRSSTRRSSGSSKAKMAVAIATPLLAFGGASYAIIALLDGEEMDANYCYARDNQHQSVIFVDNSISGHSDAQTRDYRTGLLRVWNRSPANTLIRIATTDQDSASSFAQPKFTICKPAETPAEQESIGAPSQTAPMQERIAGEARAQFEGMVDQIIADAGDPEKAAKDSPILEQLQAISNYDGFTGPNRSLTIITDGIQNSDVARFCIEEGALLPFSRFKEQRGYNYVEPRSFEGVDVTFLMVEQFQLPAFGAPYCSNAELRDFWPKYFEGNGAASVDLRRLRY